jgi:large subunit ribosomal protein L29
MKAKEAREMSIADLKDQIQLKKNELDQKKLNYAISPLEDTSYFSKTRKDIALMMTILAEKENAQ